MADRARNPTTREVSSLATDGDLLKAIVAKDRLAFERLYRRYGRRLRGYLLRWIRQPEVVEEVLNDVFFAVWTQAPRFEGRSRVSTWIFGIAYRQAMKAVDRGRRHANEVSSDELDHPEPATVAPAPELRWSLEKVLEGLTPEHRTVVELTYFEDRTYPEIAEIVEVPVNTVKTRMFHARRRLRQLLPQWGFEGV